MLEDFIEFNNLKSKIIDYPTIISMDRLIAMNKIAPTAAVKIQLFNTPKNNPFLTIIPFQSELNLSKLKKLVDSDEIIELDSRECVQITGYKKDFLPPISIYGIKIIIDSSLENKKSIFAKIEDKKLVEALMEEVTETNDDLIFEKISI
jgi:hypothetical protein